MPKSGRQAQNIQAAARRRLGKNSNSDTGPGDYTKPAKGDHLGTSERAQGSHLDQILNDRRNSTGSGDYTRVGRGDHLGTSERAMGSNLDQNAKKNRKKTPPSIAAAAQRAMSHKAV